MGAEGRPELDRTLGEIESRSGVMLKLLRTLDPDSHVKISDKSKKDKPKPRNCTRRVLTQLQRY